MMRLDLTLVVQLALLLCWSCRSFSAEIAQATDGMVFFTLRFGFEQFLEHREPTQEEVEELLCITNQFIVHKVEEQATTLLNETRPIQVFATNIDWNYTANRGQTPDDKDWSNGKSYPIEITFTAEATYATGEQDARVHQEIVFDAIDLTTEEILLYISDWVWQTDAQSLFYNAIRVHYNVKQYKHADGERTRTIRLEEASCPQTRVPTFSPLVPSSAPSAIQTVDPQGVQSTMVYFQMDLAWEESETEAEPALEEIQALMCTVDYFIQDQVSGSTQGSAIRSTATNVAWTSWGTAERAGMTVYFTSDTRYIEGDPVSIAIVAAAIQNRDEELLEFLHSEGVKHFWDQEDVNPLLELSSDATLQTLPGGTPVRVGKLPVMDCPAVTTGAPSQSTSPSTIPPKGTSVFETTATTSSETTPTPSDTFNVSAIADPSADDEGDMKASESDDSPNPGFAMVTINVDFLVSNLDGITNPDDIADQGLSYSWPLLVDDVLCSLKPSPPLVRRRRELEQTSSPSPPEFKARFASIFSVTNASCGRYSLPGLTCHQVTARYDLYLPNVDLAEKDPVEIQRFYQVATYKAILDGTYYSFLKDSMPDTPLFIGAIPVHDDDQEAKLSDRDWLFIALSLLLTLLCCCMLGVCFFFERSNKAQAHNKSRYSSSEMATIDEVDEGTMLFEDEEAVDRKKMGRSYSSPLRMEDIPTQKAPQARAA